MRGVYDAGRPHHAAEHGSSPLARGLLAPEPAAELEVRIIPACAGFTPPPARRRAECWDHPRLRGVYGGYGSVVRDCQGSSPLARGLLRPVPVGGRAGGIIPACAGFTPGRGWRRGAPGDHPRLRGVYSARWICASRIAGSSPLARGLRLDPDQPVHEGGIIPACAGFTRRHRPSRRRCPDHPRLRGVYRGARPYLPVIEGSSPLARGLRGGGPERRPASGIIPACAGFTF